MLLLHL